MANICINVDKVYDWVVQESSSKVDFTLGVLPDTLPLTATNVAAEAYLSDSTGNPLSANSIVSISKMMKREDVQFNVNGNPVTLQRIKIKKNGICCP